LFEAQCAQMTEAARSNAEMEETDAEALAIARAVPAGFNVTLATPFFDAKRTGCRDMVQSRNAGKELDLA
jgi:hypothetical protein